MDNTTTITEKYVRKPLFVDAVQVSADNFYDIARWCQAEVRKIDESAKSPSDIDDPANEYIRVRVHNPKNPRQTKAFIGDWILYTEMGYKVYMDKPFRANFDRVEEKPQDAS